MATHRDCIVYDFHREPLQQRVSGFIEDYNSEVDRYRRSEGTADIDELVRYDKVIWDRDLKKDLRRGNTQSMTNENSGLRCIDLSPASISFSTDF